MCPNQVSISPGSTTCSNCPGMEASADHTTCINCIAGKFSISGSACEPCPNHSTSPPGSEKCYCAVNCDSDHGDSSDKKNCFSGFKSCPNGFIPLTKKCECKPCPKSFVSNCDGTACIPKEKEKDNDNHH